MIYIYIPTQFRQAAEGDVFQYNEPVLHWQGLLDWLDWSSGKEWNHKTIE